MLVSEHLFIKDRVVNAVQYLEERANQSGAFKNTRLQQFLCGFGWSETGLDAL